MERENCFNSLSLAREAVETAQRSRLPFPTGLKPLSLPESPQPYVSAANVSTVTAVQQNANGVTHTSPGQRPGAIGRKKNPKR